MPSKATVDSLRALGESFPLFTLRTFLAATKSLQWKANYRLMAVSLVSFLQSNGLTTRQVFDCSLELPDDFKIVVGDLTDEGLIFYRDGVPKWMRQLDKGDSSNDVSSLENLLTAMRES